MFVTYSHIISLLKLKLFFCIQFREGSPETKETGSGQLFPREDEGVNTKLLLSESGRNKHIVIKYIVIGIQELLML